jgi:hypothetical protein
MQLFTEIQNKNKYFSSSDPLTASFELQSLKSSKNPIIDFKNRLKLAVGGRMTKNIFLFEFYAIRRIFLKRLKWAYSFQLCGWDGISAEKWRKSVKNAKNRPFLTEN